VLQRVIRAMEENQDRMEIQARVLLIMNQLCHLQHREFRSLLSARVAYIGDSVPLLNTKISDKK